ncbi:MAG: class I SAM-dependent methyltransferase [Actinomycetota bacterium]
MSDDNAQMIAYWSGNGGAAWAAAAARMDRELGSLGELAMHALGPLAGAAILDIGCGAGTTTCELARRAGPTGRAAGIDVSPTLLAIARSQAAAAGTGNVTFTETDAQDLTPGAEFDAAFSRFGVMFFHDPVAAFATVRGCVRPGGALAFVCWQSLARNPLFSVAREAVEEVTQIRQPPPDGAEPGPFAFADPDRVRQILAGAGWSGVQVQPQEDELVLDEESISERAAAAIAPGSAGGVLDGAPDEIRAQVTERVRAGLLAFRRDGLVRFRRAVWLVTART